MNKELKNKWISALRSGVYKQGKRQLKTSSLIDDVEHCCLGVLACVSGKVRSPHQLHGMGILEKIPVTKGLLSVKAQRNLASMNDDGASFAKIADYIERRL